MRKGNVRLRSLALLGFAGALAVLALIPDHAQARLRPARMSKECYYGGGVYSLGACRGGQRCVRGVNDEDYWEDDSRCSTPGGGPLPV